MLETALPYHQNTPAEIHEVFVVTTVPLDIGAELFLPEFDSGGWRCRIETAGVSVPEAAIDEDGEAVAWKDEVGRSRQVLAMQPEPVSTAMKEPPKKKLGLGVFPPYTAHHSRASRLVDYIRHGSHSYATRLSLPFRLFDQ